VPRFERICIGWDAFERDPSFAAQIRDLACAHRAHVELVHVVSGPTHKVWFSRLDDPWDRVVCSDRLRRLESIAAGLRDVGVSVHCAVPVGEPHIELIRHVDRTRCDVLYIVDEPERRGEERSFGPTTRKLLRKCPSPVWAARLGAAGHPRRVVAALDLSPSGEEAERPNEAILDCCARLGPEEVVLAHVWNLWAEELLRSRMDEPEYTRVFEQERREHEERLGHWKTRFEGAGLSTSVRLERGEARAILPYVIDEIAPDVVVMGTLCRTGLPGLIVGNTAERILNRLHASALVVKPEDFQSPVPLTE